MDKAATVKYIRETAPKHGIDPDIAVRVAKSEGLDKYVGDHGSSFGPYQLHYGGIAKGGNRHAGLGDEFTKRTGLDARDARTKKAQIDFALEHAAKHDWRAFHGAKRVGIGPRQGIGHAPAQDKFVARRKLLMSGLVRRF